MRRPPQYPPLPINDDAPIVVQDEARPQRSGTVGNIQARRPDLCGDNVHDYDAALSNRLRKVTFMSDRSLLIDLFLAGDRQGPGSDAQTERAIELTGVRGQGDLRVADLGCGTGAATLVLARVLDVPVVAVDVLGAFLRRLGQRAAQAGLAHRITAHQASMDALPFAPESLDLLWSEGAIYNIGFAAGLAYWRQFLRPGGTLAISDLTWLTQERPAELDAYWRSQYPEVDTAGAKIAVLERHGYSPVAYFALPDDCWQDTYYGPLQQRFDAFLDRHGHSAAARALVAAEASEIERYERYRPFYSYGFYIARKIG
ncbi:MAG: class I SAM-dependent methyltransferase [Gammaproteobacteria bacterium]